MLQPHNGAEQEGNVKLLYCAVIEGENVITVHDIEFITQYCDVETFNIITNRYSYLTDKSKKVSPMRGVNFRLRGFKAKIEKQCKGPMLT